MSVWSSPLQSSLNTCLHSKFVTFKSPDWDMVYLVSPSVVLTTFSADSLLLLSDRNGDHDKFFILWQKGHRLLSGRTTARGQKWFYFLNEDAHTEAETDSSCWFCSPHNNAFSLSYFLHLPKPCVAPLPVDTKIAKNSIRDRPFQ